MKTSSPVAAFILICVVLTHLAPFEANASGPLSSGDGNRAGIGKEGVSTLKSGSASGAQIAKTNLRQSSRVLQPDDVGRIIQNAKQANQEISPLFQVSSDPRDEVRLGVSNGVVTVQGSVGSEELARDVVRKYARMPGVREVRNQLTVRTNPDAEIAAKMREALSRDPETHVGAIAVTVVDRIVFLSGRVSSQEESERAEELARSLPGVARVSNGLRPATPYRYPVRSVSRVYPRR